MINLERSELASMYTEATQLLNGIEEMSFIESYRKRIIKLKGKQ